MPHPSELIFCNPIFVKGLFLNQWFSQFWGDVKSVCDFGSWRVFYFFLAINIQLPYSWTNCLVRIEQGKLKMADFWLVAEHASRCEENRLQTRENCGRLGLKCKFSSWDNKNIFLKNLDIRIKLSLSSYKSSLPWLELFARTATSPGVPNLFIDCMWMWRLVLSGKHQLQHL